MIDQDGSDKNPLDCLLSISNVDAKRDIHCTKFNTNTARVGTKLKEIHLHPLDVRVHMNKEQQELKQY